MKKKIQPMPLKAIEDITYNFPDIWEKVKADDITSAQKYCKDNDISNSLFVISGLSKWKQTKQIFDINEELCTILMKADSLDEEIPTEVIENLIFDCFYVKLPDKYIKITSLVNNQGEQQGVFELDGFFYFVCGNQNASTKSIIIVFMFSSGHTQSLGFDIYNGLSLRECINQHMSASPDVYTIINFVMQIVLYLCSNNADIEEDIEQKDIRERAKKKAERLAQEQTKPTIEKNEISYKELRKWNVGYRYGTAVKKARQADRKKHNNNDTEQEHTARQGSHSRKRTHARKGHFHHFWTGNRNGKRTLILKWVSPVIVNAEYENIVTIHKVK